MVDEDNEKDNESIDRDPLRLIDFDKSNQDGRNDKTEALGMNQQEGKLVTNDETLTAQIDQEENKHNSIDFQSSNEPATIQASITQVSSKFNTIDSNNEQKLVLDDASTQQLNQLKWEMIKGNNVILVVLEFLTHR